MKEAKAKAESNGAQDKASMNAVKELLREETKRYASLLLPTFLGYLGEAS